MAHNTTVRRRFFVDRFEERSAVITGETAHHLGRVLRAVPGQMFELSDGSTVWLGRIESVGRDRVEFTLMEPVAAREPALRLVLLLSIVKFDRFEWCLEKATELSVSEVVPLAAARSEKGLVAAAPKRLARWGKILLEASQQSRRVRAPVLRRPLKPADGFCQFAGKGSFALLLSERREAPLLKEELAGRAASAAVVAIGPEGGWTDGEFAAARVAGFAEASLGPQILRTETAVTAALAIVNYALGE
jgi:16S rRNA (uracil1498-N3)-methyltransferase